MNYYDILGVSKNATYDEIRKAYKIKALQLHPDKTKKLSDKEQKIATDEFKKVCDAHHILSNKKTREAYDQGREYVDFGEDYEEFRKAYRAKKNQGVGNDSDVPDQLIAEYLEDLHVLYQAFNDCTPSYSNASEAVHSQFIDIIRNGIQITPETLKSLLTAPVVKGLGVKTQTNSLFGYLLDNNLAVHYLALLKHLKASEVYELMNTQVSDIGLLLAISKKNNSNKMLESLQSLDFDVRLQFFEDFLSRKKEAHNVKAKFVSSEFFHNILNKCFNDEERSKLITKDLFIKVVHEFAYVDPFPIWQALDAKNKQQLVSDPKTINEFFHSLYYRQVYSRETIFGDNQANEEGLYPEDLIKDIISALFEQLQEMPHELDRCKILLDATNVLEKGTIPAFLAATQTLTAENQAKIMGMYYFSSTNRISSIENNENAIRNWNMLLLAREAYYFADKPYCYPKKRPASKIKKELCDLHTDLSMMIKQQYTPNVSLDESTFKSKWDDRIKKTQIALDGKWGDTYNILFNLLTLPGLVVLNTKNVCSGKQLRFFQFKTEHARIKEKLENIKEIAPPMSEGDHKP